MTWIIGTAADCDICLPGPYVSSRHCRLVHAGGHWTIEDLGSTNGTFVNGTRIDNPTTVAPSDRVTLGLG
jgi:pSer/pThr/pTyr-binding forkhead associated (FHA) protein